MNYVRVLSAAPGGAGQTDDPRVSGRMIRRPHSADVRKRTGGGERLGEGETQPRTLIIIGTKAEIKREGVLRVLFSREKRASCVQAGGVRPFILYINPGGAARPSCEKAGTPIAGRCQRPRFRRNRS